MARLRTTDEVAQSDTGDIRVAMLEASVQFCEAWRGYSETERAARWAEYSAATKLDIVSYFQRADSQCTTADLIAVLDMRYAAVREAAVNLADRAGLGELERLGEYARQSADVASPSDRSFFRRWANAYRHAAEHYRAGVRPVRAGSGWQVVSASRQGHSYRVTVNGCSCPSHNQGCWHAALVVGVEAGHDLSF